ADIFMHDTHTGDTIRVSQNTIIPHGNGGTTEPRFSGDDNFIAFASDATDLVEDDTNGSSDIFVINRLSGSIERVSVATGGIEANGHSYYPSVSSDGRYVTFPSSATNLVAGDTNATEDIFVHDRQTNTTERVSVTDDESEANDESSGFAPISGDGRYVVFYSNATNLVAGDTNIAGDIFLRDLQLDTTIRVSVTDGEAEGNGSSLYPNISADGEIITFISNATNLVVGDTNAQPDVFIRDRNGGTTQRISVSSEEVEGDLEVTSEAPAISSDGRYVVFASYSTNLTANDTNLVQDVFIRDVELGTTEILSISSNEIQGNDQSYKPSVSSDGRYVTFYSEATNLISGDTNDAGDIFIRDRELDTTERVSLRNNGDEIDNSSDRPDVSSDGRYVIFDSGDELIKDEDFNNGSDIFIRDRELDTTDFIINFDATIVDNDDGSNNPVISEDGAYIFFESDSSKLIQNDSNLSSDIFSYTRGNGEIELVSKNVDGVQGDDESRSLSISSDGRHVGFYSYATNLVEDDTNATADLFVVDRETDEVIRVIRTYAGGEIAGDELDDDNVFMISPDGAYVIFSSNLTNLVQTDTNARRDIFLSSLSLNSSDSGGGRSILSSGGGGGRTKVKINENTELPIPSNENGVCEPYLPVDTYLSRKRVNNPDTVMKLQRFLSLYGIQYDLPSTGYYGPRTEKAVKDLQYLYFNEILGSQGFKKPTGIVAGYTAKKINAIVCFQSLFNP
ncbi:MAG: PD40 domain-containing protein, partial [Candidatus Pacebacteria bacterium]|nr:PD40 domain-containing protein [Candidatus Paceibacterota bacterium]